MSFSQTGLVAVYGEGFGVILGFGQGFGVILGLGRVLV